MRADPQRVRRCREGGEEGTGRGGGEGKKRGPCFQHVEANPCFELVEILRYLRALRGLRHLVSKRAWGLLATCCALGTEQERKFRASSQRSS